MNSMVAIVQTCWGMLREEILQKLLHDAIPLYLNLYKFKTVSHLEVHTGGKQRMDAVLSTLSLNGSKVEIIFEDKLIKEGVFMKVKETPLSAARRFIADAQNGGWEQLREYMHQNPRADEGVLIVFIAINKQRQTGPSVFLVSEDTVRPDASCGPGQEPDRRPMRAYAIVIYGATGKAETRKEAKGRHLAQVAEAQLQSAESEEDI